MAPSQNYFVKPSLIICYSMSVTMVRLTISLVVSLILPLHVESYSSDIAFANIQKRSKLPIKIFVPYNNPAIKVMSNINFLFSNRFFGWILFGYFALQLFALVMCIKKLDKKIHDSFVRLYLGLEFVLLITCSIAGTIFLCKMSFFRSTKTRSGAILRMLLILVVFIFTFASAVGYILIIGKQFDEKVVAVEKKDDEGREKFLKVQTLEDVC